MPIQEYVLLNRGVGAGAGEGRHFFKYMQLSPCDFSVFCVCYSMPVAMSTQTSSIACLQTSASALTSTLVLTIFFLKPMHLLELVSLSLFYRYANFST